MGRMQLETGAIIDGFTIGQKIHQGGMAEMTAQLLEDPNMREQMINMMTQPGMIDMIATATMKTLNIRAMIAASRTARLS